MRALVKKYEEETGRLLNYRVIDGSEIDYDYFSSRGFEEKEVEQGFEGYWYLSQALQTSEYKAQAFQAAKLLKLQEIDAKAYEYEDNGLIAYEGLTPKGETKVVQIETTDKNIGKINGLINMFNANIITEYAWSSKNDTPIMLHQADCYALAGLFAKFSADIWMVKQPCYKAMVEACESAAEIVAIEVDYSKGIENTQSVEDDGI